MSNNSAYNPYLERDDSYAGGGGNHRPIVADNKMRLNFFGATANKESWQGVILPPFDVSAIRDPKDTEAYIETVGPCWSDVPDETRFFLPGPWSRKFLFYTFLGSSNTHFLSPRVRKNLVTHRELSDMDVADAFDDIRFFIKNSKAFTEQQRKSLLERVKQGDRYLDPPVPQGTFRHVLFSEYWSAQNPTPRVELMAITASAYKHLLDQMRWLVDERNPSIGNTCKNYLLGDALADPAGALVWSPTKRVIGEFGAANVMAFTAREQNTAGASRRVLTPEALRQRFLLGEECYWNIPSYQEMVDFAVNELVGPGKIPYEVVQQACGNRADVPPPPSGNFATAVQPGFDPMAAAQQRYAPAATPVPMAAPTAGTAVVPAAAPVPAAPSEPSYLVGSPGQTPNMLPLSSLGVVLQNTPDAMVQMPDGSWLPLTMSGLVQAPAPVPAATVPVDTVPVATVPVAAPVTTPVAAPVATPATTPAAAPAAVVDVGSEEDFRRRFCDDDRYSRLTEAGKTEVNFVAQTLRQLKLENKQADAEFMRRFAQASRADYLG